ncbi:TdcA1-ORF2 protein [Corchorus olitorius]|uniref:TdcA1-ORF2 protein n=1 Tax=Corchorus olitorius TaxID=93759 RepID=A0A1R3I565_9ROSI|nr:TdcA1-ORF2 protein [Corchorus olitorius]
MGDHDHELHVAHMYVLRNCPEVRPYYDLFVNYLHGKQCSSNEIDKSVDENFAIWFKEFVQHPDNGITDRLLHSLAWCPSKKVTSWPAYFVNGYNFHTIPYGEGKCTMNNGAHFTYDEDYNEAIFKEFKDVGSKHLSKIFAIQRGKLHWPKPEWVLDWAWEEMKAYWRSDVFKKLSEINKNNRASEGGSAGYCGGSITTGAHVDLLKEYQEAVKEAIQAAGDYQEAINRINKLAKWASVAKNSKGREKRQAKFADELKQYQMQCQDMLRDALAQIGCQLPQFPQFLAYTNIGQSSGSFEQPPSQPLGSQSGDRSSPQFDQFYDDQRAEDFMDILIEGLLIPEVEVESQLTECSGNLMLVRVALLANFL